MPKLIPQQAGKILYKLTEGLKEKKLEEATDQFMAFVRKQQLTKKLPYIIEAFEEEVKKAEGIIELEVTSAKKLSKQVMESIKNQFGSKVEATEAIDESLIGGVVVKKGNTILDGSVRTQLKKLKRELI